MKKHIEHVEPISSHLIRKLDVDELGTVLVPEERPVVESGGHLFVTFVWLKTDLVSFNIYRTKLIKF